MTVIGENAGYMNEQNNFKHSKNLRRATVNLYLRLFDKMGPIGQKYRGNKSGISVCNVPVDVVSAVSG